MKSYYIADPVLSTFMGNHSLHVQKPCEESTVILPIWQTEAQSSSETCPRSWWWQRDHLSSHSFSSQCMFPPKNNWTERGPGVGGRGCWMWSHLGSKGKAWQQGPWSSLGTTSHMASAPPEWQPWACSPLGKTHKHREKDSHGPAPDHCQPQRVGEWSPESEATLEATLSRALHGVSFLTCESFYYSYYYHFKQDRKLETFLRQWEKAAALCFQWNEVGGEGPPLQNPQDTLRKPLVEGHQGGSVVERLPLAQGVILEPQDRVPYWAPSREPTSPSACVPASLCLMNK